MKRLIVVLCVVGFIVALPMSRVVFAASKGAVKADMVVHTDTGTPEMPAGTVVGSVILNTTAKGCLIVVVNLDDGVKGVYDSLVHINGTKIIDQVAVDCLKVNAKGQGTANYKVDLAEVDIPEGATAILVKVVVRPSFGPNTTPCYVNGPKWPTEVAVPLK
jgi:hypothetical protein